MTFTARGILVVALAVGALAPGSAGALASPPQAVEQVEEPCDAGTQAEALGCYRDAAARSRAELEREFEQKLRVAADLDREFSALAKARRIPGSSLARQLQASQTEWLRYAQSQCTFEGGSSFGGSGTDILEAACRYRLNLQRLSELRAAGRLLDR